MTISLLGRLAVDVDGTPADVARLGDLGRLALAYLVLERRRPVPRDELADVLWGEDVPATWDSSLRGVLSRVRATLVAAGLPPEALAGHAGCYQLHLPHDAEVDVESVAAALVAAEADLAVAPEQARSVAARAAEMVALRLLPGASGEWVERRQADLAQLRVRALELLAASATATGDHAAAVAAAEEAVALAPLRESAHQRLMAAHARAGNRAAGLKAYQRCRATLAEELGVSPSSETEALYLSLLGDEPAAGPATRATTNLPADRTTFVGRDEAVEALATMLDTTRLLTLTGPGGVGKSRLAVRVARARGDDLPGGAWMVELAGLSDPRLVPQQVLAVLGAPEVTGIPPTEAVSRFLADRSLLLVLDNCEHLVAACADLCDRMLSAAPGLRVLATSREPLGVAGETTWTVPPLPQPDASRLFRDRARAAAPSLDLGPAAEDDVARICERVDGIPLAVELAAARARSLSLPEIAARLDDRLRLLVGGPRTAPGRHQAIRATIDWSFEALTAAEQDLFARLSVFAGGFVMAAAEAVAGTDDALDVLAALVDKSMVTVDHRGPDARYRVLEPLRQYAAERLTAAGSENDARARHLAWAAELAESAETGLEGGDQARCLAVLDAEHDNLRAALGWAATTGATEPGLRLASSLLRYWEIRGHLSEGRAHLQSLAAQGDGSPELRAKALNAAAVLAQRQGDHAGARTLYQESLVIRRALDDRVGIATALHGLANLAVVEDDLVTARSLFEENLAIARELGRDRMEAASLMNLGVVAHSSFMRGHREIADAGAEAQRWYRQALDAYTRLGDRYGMALALENLGALERLYTGDHEAARALHEQSLAIRRELGDKLGIAGSARYLAALALMSGRIGTARQLNEERLRLEREVGNLAAVAEVLADLAFIALGDSDLDAARSMLDEAVAIVDKVGRQGWSASLLSALGDIARRQGDLALARSALDDALAVARQHGNAHGEAWAVASAARLARTAGDMAGATALAGEALALAEAGDMAGVEVGAIEALAGSSAAAGDLRRAVRLYAAADALRGRWPQPPDPERSADLAAARSALGSDFDTAWDEGASLSGDERRQLAREAFAG
ncbi:MAG TPA: tetratricopeptide repeat protein [Acidimicrobiales bacterium]